MKDETTIAFVREHREDDVRTLALQARRYPDVDMAWALDQIQGWQTARHKLPSWAAIDGIIYPPHLSMEQCSSEQTALYKCGIIDSLPDETHETLVDLTGGFGVDFAFMATKATRAIYVERQAQLCETARHNFGLLNLHHAIVINDDAEHVLTSSSRDWGNPDSTLVYLDPARRDGAGGRTYAIADCSPNVLELMDKLLESGHRVLIKLSPMLDWHKAISDLGKKVSQVHIVSVGGECKELLILLDAEQDDELMIHCENDGNCLIYKPSESNTGPALMSTGYLAAYLYEPNASIMKAGCFGLLTQRYPVKAIATDSHLFVSEKLVKDFPGRSFGISGVTTMNKKELKRALEGISKANITTRNFPLSAQQLRQRLRLKDGGDTYIFGTTNAMGEYLLYICHKIDRIGERK